MKNRLLAVGVLLLGIAAVGKVALSFIQHTDKLKQQQEEQLFKKQELQRSEIERIRLSAIITNCNQEAIKAAADFKGDDELYNTAYRLCLRRSGLE